MIDNATLAAQAIAESIAQTATHGRIDEETYQNVFSETFNRVVRLAARIAELEAEVARLTSLAEKVRIDASLMDVHIRSCERIAREEEREVCVDQMERIKNYADQIIAAIRARPTP